MKRTILLILFALLTTSLPFVHAQAGSSTTITSTAYKSRWGKYGPTRRIRSHPNATWTSTTKTALPLASTSAVLPQFALQSSVNLAPYNPQLVAIDPYANAVASGDGLKPFRPFWYSVDKDGLTILRLYDNTVVYRVLWPATIDVVQADGEFVNIPAPPSGWEPVGITMSYPTDEALASSSETPASYLFVVMARSGYEWASNPSPPDLRDPNVRDTLTVATSAATESSMLVQVDVTDPSFLAAPPSVAGAILGHGAGQPVYDPSTDTVYVGNMPSNSLPTTPAVANDLTSFVSVIAPMAPPAAEAAGGELPGAPEPPVVVICGPEHPDEGLLVGEPYVWACVESGDGPATWEFQNLPPWLFAHADKLTGQLDGLLYGIPTADGTWTFQARVTDYGEDPAGLASDWATYVVNVTPLGVASEAEAGFEAGIPGGQGIAGTGNCTPAATASPGSMVPKWIDSLPAVVNGVVKGCYIMGTAPISGEHYEFALPNFHFAYPFNYDPVIFTGNVIGPYMFDSLPKGVGFSGLAWHQIEKIHDPTTEADILNVEFIGVDPFTGQLYRILPPQGAPEGSGGEAVLAPPEISIEPDTITTEGQPILGALVNSRTEFGNYLTGSRSIKFGDLVVEVDRDIFVSAVQISDPTGADPTVIPIGGPTGSTIENGALVKVSGGIASAINLPGVQAYYLGLDSDLRPAVPGTEPGQVDNGDLWVTGTTSGNVAVVDTAAGSVSQSLAVSLANSLGGVAVDPGAKSAYVAGMSLQNVTIFGSGSSPAQSAPVIWGADPVVGFELTLDLGKPGTYTIVATGIPTPKLSYVGTLPSGVTFVDNLDGTATLAGIPTGVGADYSGTITASNNLGNDTAALLLTVQSPPAITSANTTTFMVGAAGSFTVTTTGGPAPSFTCPIPDGGVEGGNPPPGTCVDLPSWLLFTDNGDGTGTLAGTPPAGSAGSYVFNILATNDIPPDATQTFTLVVKVAGANNPPAAAAQSVTTAQDTPVAITLSGSDPDGDVLTYAVVTQPAHGTLSGAAPNLTYAPASGYTGSDSFTFKVNDGIVDSAPAMVSITVTGGAGVNHPPVAAAQSVTTAEDTAKAIILSGSDPDGDALTYTVVTQPAHGTLSGAAQNLSYTPALNYNGPDSFTFKVNDGMVDSAAAMVSITVTAVNDPPVATAQSVTTAEDTAKTIILSGSDPDPNVLTYSVVTQPVHGTLSGAAPNLTYTPALNYNGPDSFTFKINDGLVDSASAAVSITVTAVNDPPVATAQSVTTAQGTAKAITLSGSDPDGNVLTYAVVTQPLHGTLSGTAPNLTYTPASGYTGPDSFTFKANDGSVDSAPATVSITVTAPPVTISITTASPLPSGTVNQPYSQQLQAQGGTPPYRWRRSAGNLPRGLALSNSGVISGTPSRAGTYSFTIRVTDSASHSASKSFTVTISR